jgi:hypothetical protein
MIKRHQSSGQQVVTSVFLRTLRLTTQFEPRPITHETSSAPRRDRARPVDWGMFAVSIMVILSFAALFFCLYVIRAKCQVAPPF